MGLPARARAAALCRASIGVPGECGGGAGKLGAHADLARAYLTADGRERYQAHGNLNATLVNREDPSDSVVLDLDF